MTKNKRNNDHDKKTKDKVSTNITNEGTIRISIEDFWRMIGAKMTNDPKRIEDLVERMTAPVPPAHNNSDET